MYGLPCPRSDLPAYSCWHCRGLGWGFEMYDVVPMPNSGHEQPDDYDRPPPNAVFVTVARYAPDRPASDRPT